VQSVAITQQCTQRGGDLWRLEKRAAPQAGRGVEQVVPSSVAVERCKPIRNAATGSLDTAREHVLGDRSMHLRRRRRGEEHVALHDEPLHDGKVVGIDHEAVHGGAATAEPP
jgi:hypothetical protein